MFFFSFWFFDVFTGEVQQIAGQLIELGKKNASSDNISVIVIFLKDPHQIVAEHKFVDASTPVTRMDFESTNGLVHLEDNSSAVTVHDNETPSPDKLHVDFNKSSDMQTHHDDAVDANNFFFGKNSGGEFNSESINATSPSITSNGDGEKFIDNESHVGRSIDDDHDDFGPETDVDATDDNAISPLSPSVSFGFVIVVGRCHKMTKMSDFIDSHNLIQNT